MLAQDVTGRRKFPRSDAPVTRALLISDASPSDSLRANLERGPLDLQWIRPGARAVAKVLEYRPHVLVVDCRFDEPGALRLCADLRSVGEIASAFMVAITAGEREDLRIRAFDAGADDCFAEPQTARELWSRLDAINRRIRKDLSAGVLRYADVELDLRRHKVRRGDRSIPLSSLQMRLLRYLMENPATVFTRDELLEAVWGDKTLDEGAVTVGIVRLRRALNLAGGPNLIRQVRGVGYALDSDSDN